jgi:tetratricopeptide (TPR) repeat protein
VGASDVKIVPGACAVETMRRLTIALWLVLTAAAFGAVKAADDPRMVSGWDHFYNLEFDAAIADFAAASKAYPQDADIHNNIAQALLYREMLRNGALESELVSGVDSFLRKPKMNPTAEVQKQFDDELNRAISMAQAALQKNANDVTALYSLGVSYGLRSNYNFLVRKAWRDSLRDATEARKMHARVTELQPNNYDARLTQGIHEFVVGSLPWHLRTVGFLMGFHGDKEGGLRTIQDVAKKGERNRVDAEIVLCVLYRREERYKDAIPVLNDLSRRYPRDYLFEFEKAQMYSALGNKKEALAAIERVAQFKQSGASGFSAVPWEKIYYQKANIEFWYNDLDAALANMKKVTADPKDLDLSTGVLAYMRQGQIHDLQHKHDLAIADYKQAIAFAPEAEAAKESERYIREPYRRGKAS